jgi:hypothetical protein
MSPERQALADRLKALNNELKEANQALVAIMAAVPDEGNDQNEPLLVAAARRVLRARAAVYRGMADLQDLVLDEEDTVADIPDFLPDL